MHFPVIGECLGWRTTDFEELYGDLGQWTMTKELAREVSGFYLSSPCEVWWIAESVLNMSRSRADGTMSSWLLYFWNFYKFPYSFLYYLDATTDEMHKRARHLVQYFCQWKHICFKFSLKKVKQFLNLVSSLRQRTVGEWMNFSKIDVL